MLYLDNPAENVILRLIPDAVTPVVQLTIGPQGLSSEMPQGVRLLGRCPEEVFGKKREVKVNFFQNQII